MSFFSKLFGGRRIDIAPDEMSWRRNSPPPQPQSQRQSNASIGSSSKQGTTLVANSGRGVFGAEFTGKSRDRAVTQQSPTNYAVFSGGEPNPIINKPFKANSSRFYRYRAEQIKQRNNAPQGEFLSQYQNEYNPSPDRNPVASPQALHLNSLTNSQVIFGSQPNNLDYSPTLNTNQVYRNDWNEERTSAGNLRRSGGAFEMEPSPAVESIYDIEKRVGLRMMAQEEAPPVSQRETMNIFNPAPKKIAPSNRLSAMSSLQNIPDINSSAAITARPEASMRKLQIFEKLASDNNAAQPATTAALRGPGRPAELNAKVSDLNGQTTKIDMKRKVDNEIQDFDSLLVESRRLGDELHRLEVEHRNLMNDPRNMTVQEANFRILLENGMDEERKRDKLKKDIKTIEAEINNKQVEATLLRAAQGGRTMGKPQPVDLRERENILAEIEKTRDEISAKKIAIENQQLNKDSRANRVRETSERQMAMDLQSKEMTVNNDNEALLSELKHFEKEYL